MNRLRRIKSVSGIRAFSSLLWKGEDAAQYNLIYGWNGSGKTTLARILSFYEQGTVHLDGFREVECRLKTDDGSVSERDFASEKLDVRVFNEDFIQANLRFRDSIANPIVLIGEASVQVEEELKGLKGETAKREVELAELEERLKVVPNPEKILTDSARAVADEFAGTPLASGRYQARSYKRPQVEQLLENGSVTKDSLTSLVIEKQAELDGLRDRVSERHSEVLFEQPKLDDLAALFSEGNELLQRNIEVATLERLEEDDEVRSWVKEGHRMHVDRHRSECLFCENDLPRGLLERYGAFFTGEVAQTEERLDKIARRIAELEETITPTLPDSSDFFADLAELYMEASKHIRKHAPVLVKACRRLRTRLDRRRGKMQVKGSEEEPVDLPAAALSSVSSAFEEVERLCKEQNERLADDSTTTETAAQALELHTIASTLTSKEYFKHEETSNSLREEHEEVKEKLQDARRTMRTKRATLRDTAIAVDEINAMIEGFLGKGEVELNAAGGEDEAGYRVTSRGEPTKYLSEGEKSVVALSYFLVKLNEEDSDPENTVVVIDDPVDSQDTIFLFRTFGLMKRHLKDVGQLFLLTHNYDLFNLVRDWLSRKDSASLYWIELRRGEKPRTVEIADLPELLRDYKTEYQYLFSRLYTHRDKKDIESPLVPNVARKVLEYFAAFKWSCRTQERFSSIVHNRFVRNEEDHRRDVGDAMVKFLHEYSHGQDFGRPVTAAVLEANEICESVLEFIKIADEDHYKALVREIEKCE